jgi:predicted metal-dependent hydrolase
MKPGLIVIGMLSVILLCFAKTTYKRVYQISNYNKKLYLVRVSDKNSQIKSANLLASLSIKKNKLCDFISNSPKYKNHYGIKRLLANKNVKLEELSYEYNNEAAYSINKGERIGICLRNKNGNIEDENTMMFVLMHELAHIMSKKYAHDAEFWSNFALLIKAANECGVYVYKNYSSNPTTYCGHDITHTPK